MFHFNGTAFQLDGASGSAGALLSFQAEAFVKPDVTHASASISGGRFSFSLSYRPPGMSIPIPPLERFSRAWERKVVLGTEQWVSTDFPSDVVAGAAHFLDDDCIVACSDEDAGHVVVLGRANGTWSIVQRINGTGGRTSRSAAQWRATSLAARPSLARRVPGTVASAKLAAWRCFAARMAVPAAEQGFLSLRKC